MQVRVVPICAGCVHVRQDDTILVALARKDVYQHVIRGAFQRRVLAVDIVRSAMLIAVAIQTAWRHLEAVKVYICVLKACRLGRIEMMVSGTVVTRERRHDVEIVFERKI